MPTSRLAITKLYIDSQFRSDSSDSSSDFDIRLPTSVELPENCCCIVDEVCIPNTFQSIIAGVNNHLYAKITNAVGVSTICNIPIAEGSYDGTEFATLIGAELNNCLIGLPNPGFFTYYNQKTNRLTISCLNAASIVSFKIYSDAQLAAGSTELTYITYDKNNIMSCNDLLRNYINITGSYSSGNPFVSGFLNLIGYSELYITSSTLGTFSTLNCFGNYNIIKKVQVSQSYGNNITSSAGSHYDHIKCGGQTLRKLSFKVNDAKGNNINLGGSHWSTSLIFFVLNE